MIRKLLSSLLCVGMIGCVNQSFAEDAMQKDAVIGLGFCGFDPQNSCSCVCDPVDVLVFKADTTQCRIGVEDRTLLDSGAADFVTAFGGEDFTCSTISVPRKLSPSGSALQILPANGDSFTFGVPPLGVDGPVVGGVFDHVKFLAYSILNYAPIDGTSSVSTWIGSGRQRHVFKEPYNAIAPGSVVNPREDARLACYGFVSLDPTHLVTSDWICTDDVIYALYERLPGFEAIFGYYAAFTYMIPVYTRDSKNIDLLNDYHKFQTAYNRKAGTITWIFDGKPVFQVQKIGHRLGLNNGRVFAKNKPVRLKNPDFFKVNDHGGDNVLVDPIGFETGLSFFTLLDFFRPNNTTGQLNRGLVRLESNQFRSGGTQQGFFYNNPLVPGRQARFVISSPLDASCLLHVSTIPSSARLWGQGAELRLASYEVSEQ